MQATSWPNENVLLTPTTRETFAVIQWPPEKDECRELPDRGPHDATLTMSLLALQS